MAGGSAPQIEAVVFDFGQTLFQWRGRDRVPEFVAEGVAELLGWDAAGQAEMVRRTQAAWPAILQRSGFPLLELDLVAALVEVFGNAGHPMPYAVMKDLIRREHLRWDGERELHPDVVAMLRELKDRGIKVGILSNTIDPPELFARDMKTAGLDSLVDFAICSTAVGARKPNPLIYRAMLKQSGCTAASVLFVGDRVLEDVRAPEAEGMQAALATWYRNEPGKVRFRLTKPADVIATIRAIEGANPGLSL